MHCLSQTYLNELAPVVVTIWGDKAVSLTTHLVFGLESGGLMTFFSVNKRDTFVHMASNWPTERIPVREL